jgi:AcrR family transcriptional regulator
MAVNPGRPRAASPQLLEDAATELFIENGYAATTVDAIAHRAGVSRNTFFNYFGAKSDVLWFGADLAIDAVREECDRAWSASGPWSASGSGGASSARPLHFARSATLVVARSMDNDRVPLALTQLEVMGSKEEVVQSGLVRVGRLAQIYLACLAGDGLAPDATTRAAAASSALAAAAASAWVSWARAGTTRAPLVDFLEQSFAPLFSGFDSTES